MKDQDQKYFFAWQIMFLTPTHPCGWKVRNKFSMQILTSHGVPSNIKCAYLFRKIMKICTCHWIPSKICLGTWPSHSPPSPHVVGIGNMVLLCRSAHFIKKIFLVLDPLSTISNEAQVFWGKARGFESLQEHCKAPCAFKAPKEGVCKVPM